MGCRTRRWESFCSASRGFLHEWPSDYPPTMLIFDRGFSIQSRLAACESSRPATALSSAFGTAPHS